MRASLEDFASYTHNNMAAWALPGTSPAATARTSQPTPQCSSAAPGWAWAPPGASAPAQRLGTWHCRCSATAGCISSHTCGPGLPQLRELLSRG